MAHHPLLFTVDATCLRKRSKITRESIGREDWRTRPSNTMGHLWCPVCGAQVTKRSFKIWCLCFFETMFQASKVPRALPKGCSTWISNLDLSYIKLLQRLQGIHKSWKNGVPYTYLLTRNNSFHASEWRCDSASPTTTLPLLPYYCIENLYDCWTGLWNCGCAGSYSSFLGALLTKCQVKHKVIRVLLFDI